MRNILLVFGIINLLILTKGFYECKNRKNAYGLTPYLLPFGIFAWGDAFVLGIFWFLTSIVAFISNNNYLFPLIFSTFWVVRSLGETIYWFNQQFSGKIYGWNKPEKLMFYWLFQGDAIWFVYQVLWQCITVISALATIYFSAMWIRSLN